MNQKARKSKPETIKDIKQKCLDEGFDIVGICPATLPDQTGAWLREFLGENYHGDMQWMADRVYERSSPDQLWPEAKSVIMLGMNYGPDVNPLDKLLHKEMANISVYAGNKDYHDLIKKALKRIGRWIVETYDCQIKVFVDTAPVMEKPLGQLAGLGWQGKHTNLVSRELGSWFFLGSIFIELDLSLNPSTEEKWPDTDGYDKAEIDHCGRCTRCLDICPTKAFPSPYKLDARRCISYLTIEYKGHIDVEFRKAMANRIYGCDDCLAICPWNKFAQETEKIAFQTRDSLLEPKLEELVLLDDTAFRQLFTASPIKRIGRDRFIRNVLIAIGNSEDEKLIPLCTDKLSEENPIIRAMAVWALFQLCDNAEFEKLRNTHIAKEQDAAVKTEWAMDDF